MKVWDLATRLFHLALIITVSLSLYSAFEDKFGIWGTIHYWSGITVFALIFWRVFYGFFGSETNLFRRFIKGPRAVYRSFLALKARRVDQTIGHGAAGGWSVLIMLLLLFGQAGLGLFASDDMFFSGPFSSKSHIWPFSPTALHETIGFVVMGWVSLHIVFVSVYKFWGETNLITPMITGRRNPDTQTTAPKMRPWSFGLISLLVTTISLAWLIG